MRNILNRWEIFLTEQHFGQEFEQFKKENCSTEQCLNSLGFKLIGHGTFRSVYELPGTAGNQYVLKVSKPSPPGRMTQKWPIRAKGDELNLGTLGFFRKQTGQKTLEISPQNANVFEADVKMQQKYGDIIPKVYDAEKGFGWILVEKVEPETKSQFWEAFPEFGAIIKRLGSGQKKPSATASTAIAKKTTKTAAVDSQLDDTLDVKSVGVRPIDYFKSLLAFEASSRYDIQAKYKVVSLAKHIQTMSPSIFEHVLNNLRKNVKFSRLVDLIAEFNVEPEEADYRNFGVRLTGDLVLLDAGIFASTPQGSYSVPESKIQSETIKKVGRKYVVYSKKGGKRLGTHKTKKSAKKQLAAIEINKEKTK